MDTKEPNAMGGRVAKIVRHGLRGYFFVSNIHHVEICECEIAFVSAEVKMAVGI